MSRDMLKVAALIGAAILAIGVFLPVIQVPKRGALTMMDLEWGGVILLVFAGITATLAVLGWTRHVLWPGIGAMGLIGYAYQRANAEIAQSRLRLGEGVGDDPLAALRDLAASNSRMDYGWAVMAIAAAIVVVAGLLAGRNARHKQRPD